jgi:flagellar biosynthesis/type III secretory pathway M-ring protein FliF/YscJ
MVPCSPYLLVIYYPVGVWLIGIALLFFFLDYAIRRIRKRMLWLKAQALLLEEDFIP